MSVLNTILSRLQAADPEFEQRISPRRNLIKNAARATTMAALPLALGGLLKRAYGKSTDAVTDTLNLALLAEMLEAEFYRRGLDANNLITAAQDRNEIKVIYEAEVAHREFLKTTITSLSGTPRPEPVYDFTGGNGSQNGPFSGVFDGYVLFLAVAQTFEVAGVRAYKGAAPSLMGNDTVLTAALNIHSVEARHAAHIQMMRRRNGHATDLKPWLTLSDPKIPAGAALDAAAPVYAGEENTTQAGKNIIGLGNQAISQNAASEAFDEPISVTTAAAILDLFTA